MWHGVSTTVLRRNPHQDFCGLQVLHVFSFILQERYSMSTKKLLELKCIVEILEQTVAFILLFFWVALREISWLFIQPLTSIFFLHCRTLMTQTHKWDLRAFNASKTRCMSICCVWETHCYSIKCDVFCVFASLSVISGDEQRTVRPLCLELFVMSVPLLSYTM